MLKIEREKMNEEQKIGQENAEKCIKGNKTEREYKCRMYVENLRNRIEYDILQKYTLPAKMQPTLHRSTLEEYILHPKERSKKRGKERGKDVKIRKERKTEERKRDERRKKRKEMKKRREEMRGKEKRRDEKKGKEKRRGEKR